MPQNISIQYDQAITKKRVTCSAHEETLAGKNT